MSLPPLWCKQVEVWIHYKSIIVLSYHSASLHMMESHQNESRLLVSKSEQFHSHFISSLYNLTHGDIQLQHILILYQGHSPRHSFQIIGRLQLLFPRRAVLCSSELCTILISSVCHPNIMWTQVKAGSQQQQLITVPEWTGIGLNTKNLVFQCALTYTHIIVG